MFVTLPLSAIHDAPKGVKDWIFDTLADPKTERETAPLSALPTPVVVDAPADPDPPSVDEVRKAAIAFQEANGARTYFHTRYRVDRWV